MGIHYLILVTDIMARNQKASIIILDVGSRTSVSSEADSLRLDNAKDIACNFLSQKILTSKNNRMGLITVGSTTTKNLLNSSYGEYNNIEVHHDEPIAPTLDFIRLVQSLSLTNQSADVISGLIVATDLILNTCAKIQNRTIYLVADFSKEFHGVNDLSIIANQMKTHNISLCVVALDLNISDITEDKFGENHKLLMAACEEIGGVSQFISAFDFLKLLSTFRSQNVLQTTKSRPLLELTPGLKIPVWVTIKTKAATMSTLVKRSKFAPADSSGTVTRRITTYATDDPTKKHLHADEVIKSFRYGPQIIPIEPHDEPLLSNPQRSTKCLRTLAAVPISQIDRSFLLGNSEFVSPEEGNLLAQVSFISLVRALSDVKAALVCRFVARDGADPKLVCLSPLIEFASASKREQSHGHMIECAQSIASSASLNSREPTIVTATASLGSLLANYQSTSSYLPGVPGSHSSGETLRFLLVLNYLPFAEDIRPMNFNPLPFHRVTTSQQEAVDALVDSMSLVDSVTIPTGPGVIQSAGEERKRTEKIEMLRPELTFNPAIQRCYQTLTLRALHANLTEIPRLNSQVFAYLHPNMGLLNSVTQRVVPLIESSFELTKQEKISSKDRTLWRKTAAAKEASLLGTGNEQSAAEIAKKIHNLGDDAFGQVNHAAESNIANANNVNNNIEVKDEFGGINEPTSVNPAMKPEATVRTVVLSTANPVRDFVRAVQNRNMDMVEAAMNELESIIERLLIDSVDQRLNFVKVRDCLVSYRQNAISELEPKKWNSFIKRLYNYAMRNSSDPITFAGGLHSSTNSGAFKAFWTHLQEKDASVCNPIARDEAPNSDLSLEDKARFFESSEPVVAGAFASMVNARIDNDEDDILALVL